MRRWTFLVLAILTASCSRQPAVEEITTTNGPLTIIAADEIAPMVDTLTLEFARIYTGIRPTVSAATSREAIAHLLNDSVRTIVVDRAMNEEEQKVLAEAGWSAASTILAWDALVAVVNADHAIAGLTPTDITSIVTGEASRWTQVKGSSRKDAIEFVCTDRNSGIHEQILRRISGGRPLRVFASGADQRELVEYVGRAPRAIALVSLAAARQRPVSTRIVPVESMVDTVSRRWEYVVPTQLSVYEGRYPFRTEVLAYNAERRLGPGAGFAAFALTTPGQKIVQNTGLVPAVIPNRVIQLTAE